MLGPITVTRYFLWALGLGVALNLAVGNTALAYSHNAAPSSSSKLPPAILLAQANLAPSSSSPGVGSSTAKSPASAKTAGTPAGATVAATTLPGPSKPLWQDLSPAQQQSLKPLGANWGNISESQKRKWLELSKNYPRLSPAEQTTLHSRMTEWTNMSPQQRNQARLNFAETNKLAPDDKAAKWQAYQALSPEEKQKLAAKATPPTAGATAAVKPVPAQKLAPVPSTRLNPKSPEVAANSPKVDKQTLLPKAPGTADSRSTSKN